MKATPRELGRAAFDAGKGLDQNPFEVDSDDAFDWIDGGLKAKLNRHTASRDRKNPMSAPYQNLFKLSRPCANCPFLKQGAIELAPGRLDGIVETLALDDRSAFHCHKTVHNARTGGQWDEEGNYAASGHESMCAGAMIYLEKVGRPTVGMRIGRVLGMYSPDNLAPHFDAVIEPAN